MDFLNRETSRKNDQKKPDAIVWAVHSQRNDLEVSHREKRGGWRDAVAWPTSHHHPIGKSAIPS